MTPGVQPTSGSAIFFTETSFLTGKEARKVSLFARLSHPLPCWVTAAEARKNAPTLGLPEGQVATSAALFKF
jgi:hypothetical protein